MGNCKHTNQIRRDGKPVSTTLNPNLVYATDASGEGEQKGFLEEFLESLRRAGAVFTFFPISHQVEGDF